MANWTQAQLREMDALRLELDAIDKRHLATIARHARPSRRPSMASDDVRALAELHRIRVWLTADQMDLLRYARQDEAWFTQFIEDPAAAHERMWEVLRKRREAAKPTEGE